MAAPTPSRAAIHAEMEQARRDFHQLLEQSTPEGLARRSSGTRWTNRQLLFHMMFGYLITRNLRIVVKIVTRAPLPVQRGFAGLLDAATRPFHHVNYLGSCAGARVVTDARLGRWCDRVLDSLHRHLDADSDAALARSMAFPVRWDPYFTPRMSLGDVYHYATVHYAHHRRQLTLHDAPTIPFDRS
jgi:hypothetical protein